MVFFWIFAGKEEWGAALKGLEERIDTQHERLEEAILQASYSFRVTHTNIMLENLHISRYHLWVCRFVVILNKTNAEPREYCHHM